MLTSLIALLNVAGPRLDGGTLAPVVETVTRATALLDSIATGRRTGGPLRPRGPAVIRRVAGCRGSRVIWYVITKVVLVCSSRSLGPFSFARRQKAIIS